MKKFRLSPFSESDQKVARRNADYRRQLIRRRAKIGGQLFGSIPKGHRREFFCLDPHTWVWYEEWKDETGTRAQTTRYDVRPNGVVKIQDGQPPKYVTLEEGRNLYQAVGMYRQRINAETAAV